jgi:hypothetical protein
MDDWQTSNLPRDQTDLDKLMGWFHEHDAEWMSDALWLRYLKIARRVYRSSNSDRTWELHEAHFDQLPFARKAPQSPPFPTRILPEVPPSDGVDRLIALPHDIRIEILSYLLVPELRGNVYGGVVMSRHALNNLALASKGWRDQVEAICGHFLLTCKHKVDDQCECGDPSRWVEWRKLSTYTANARMEYVIRARRYCSGCGEPASRLSIKWPGLLCCESCEMGGYQFEEESSD